jgi:hypothetical protein
VVRSPAVRRAALICAVVLCAAGCGSDRQDANEPEGEFTFQVLDASFPASQTTAEPTTMRLRVRNTDDRAIPNLAVTVETEPQSSGAAPAAFGLESTDARLADSERPVWIVDREPTGGESAYTNTWAFGAMRPGETRDLVWRVTAVRPGTYTVNFRVSPGLNGKARVASGQKPTGSFRVTISDEPVPARVNAKGEVVRGEG